MALRNTQGVRPVSGSASALPARIETLANRQIIEDMTANSGNASITQINPGRVAVTKKIAPQFTISVINTTVAAVDAFILNMADYTENAVGVNSVYSDGFTGKLINKLLADLDGLLIYGFNITGYDEDGNKSDDVVNSSALELRNYNGSGTSFDPTHLDIAGSERNTQFKDGLFTVKTQFVLNCLSQLKMQLGAGCKISLTLFTRPVKD